ncbi:GntR family transcriptional regulator [Rhodoplanes sp. TEM]|uniref:GntR family transcriptional regulator n=1 Tax=Rhodoplanes tepidamans TaxID=200616 RepID=A0ABT5J727_RHOTP|nr:MULTISPECIES: GntR family transcriptional regulator [Rhodoplanes]MDC7785429.1 GntR family transcriptional regulator [Rhodoplanes tepidamans]MDC7985790.1 GntR family transcriptional regulator [Rhodoplanes sp. TEM]MDQ0353117.1 DNA-binding GntR family transcriptional regulator [Rhodoplanes tepidamans]
MPAPLPEILAARIGDLIRNGGAAAGARLVERRLAEQLRVSRSPVRRALRILAQEGVVGGAPGGGFVVLAPDAAASLLPPAEPDDEGPYLQIAADRLDGLLPERVSETALMRRYGLTRARLGAILRRIAAEGWIERLPGHGWAFLPVLTSLQAYADSYRFRLVIEPAAILEPGFVLDRAAIAACRAAQQRLVDGDIRRVSNATLFDLNSRFHETVIACSRNTFFIDSLRRVDRLRRLIEYRRTLDRDRAVVRCREHVALADLLLAGRRAEAAAFMREHLASVGPEKVAEPRSGAAAS